MNDELATWIKNDHPQLQLIGAWAPMQNPEATKARNFIRSYFSL